ncbi:MAG: RNA methyltransferase [Patescibacteria group bacterium]|jgi:tRNA (guanosine-2'-O-)-methyltransferase
MTPKREQKMKDVAERRFQDLHVLLENVDDPHNLGAILRTCDAVGVSRVHLVYTESRPPRMSELRTKAAASAVKWLDIKKWTSLEECLTAVRSEGFKIVVTALTETGVPQWEIDFIQPTVLAIGNEHDGVSAALLAAADTVATIPMRGMVQSLNVSVATAVILEEALRQRISSK